MKIQWRGDHCHNHNDRAGHKAVVLCNHVTAGTAQSVYYWFTSPNNHVGSSHFVVCRNGEIHQYVDIKRAAWTQGITPDRIPFSTAAAVHEMGVNPNFYSIGIEHEGYVEGYELNGRVHLDNHGLDGDLTDVQFYASCWLHKFLQDEIERLYSVRMSLNSRNVIGHYQVDPKRKPFCPGDNFPWTRLYSELAIADRLSLEDYEERLDYLMGDDNELKELYAFVQRNNDLYNKAKDSKNPYAKEARRKLKVVAQYAKEKGIV